MSGQKLSQLDQPGAENPMSGLEALVARAGKHRKGLPPVEKWHPDYCGEIDMVIKRDGTWFYMGTPIGRAPLVRLFSTVLRKDEDGKTYLVTPVEKIGITIEDAPFVAVEMDAEGEGDEKILTFRTNVGDVVQAGPENPLRFEFVEENQGVKPYMLIRGRLEALINRAVMYELVAQGEELEIEGQKMFAVRSNGAVFAIMPASELAKLSA